MLVYGYSFLSHILLGVIFLATQTVSFTLTSVTHSHLHFCTQLQYGKAFPDKIRAWFCKNDLVNPSPLLGTYQIVIDLISMQLFPQP